jgi:hypothetical protein
MITPDLLGSLLLNSLRYALSDDFESQVHHRALLSAARLERATAAREGIS